ncbi:GGDEF domain-containing protein [Chitinimonas naiadis]
MHVAQMPSLLERLGSLTSIRDTELLEQSLLKTVLSTLNIADCSLYRLNDRQDFLRVVHLHRSSKRSEAEGDSVLERAEIEYSNIVLSDDLLELIDTVKLTLHQASRKIGSKVLNVYPLFGRAGMNGYLAFESRQAISLSHASILKGVLQLYRNYYTLLDESQRDKLTGLLNRHALDQGLDRMLAALSNRQLQPTSSAEYGGDKAGEDQRKADDRQYWLAVIDVDHFKPINDNYGHIVGDEILLLIAQTMHRSLREGDLLYRYGGEEFVVITTTDNTSREPEQLERLRAKVEQRDFPQVGRVTVSIGYCRFDSLHSASTLIAHADKALYEAKRGGRNQVANYGALVESGVIKQDAYGSVELF